ncbi:uncharacterized protein LOC144714598 [Wolffia australiana]
MIKGKACQATALAFGERCKNILGANWLAQLYTVKADSKGSKDDVYSSKVKYILKRGNPYLWVPEGDMHNVNTLIDERGSLSVSSPIPGPLMSLLRSVKKFPARVAFTGDVLPLREAKAEVAFEALRRAIEIENRAIDHASYSVTGILSSANASCRARCHNFEEIVNRKDDFVIYKFSIRSCTFIDSSGGTWEVEDLDTLRSSKQDLLLPFSEKIIDGINHSEARRRALIFFCLVYLNISVRDAFLLSVDHKGIDVLAKVPSKEIAGDAEWREVRIAFKDEVPDVEAFCNLLVEMEEATLGEINSFSGLG